MKNNTQLFILILLIAVSSTAQTVLPAFEISTEEVDGKTISLYKNEPFTGFSIQTLKNGKPISWVSYKNGLADGQWQEWYENGNLRFDSYWKEGKGHGPWKYFHENGKLRQEEFFDMDAAIGIFKSFWPNGQLRLNSSWLQGQKHGMWTYYDESGSPIKTEMYLNDALIASNPIIK